MTCLIATKQILELTSKFPGETKESILGLVSIWQQDNNKTIDDYPTEEELRETLKIRETKNASDIEANKKLDNALEKSADVQAITSIQTQAKVDLLFGTLKRKDRALLIGRLFSVMVSQVMDENNKAYDRRIENASDEETIAQLQNSKNQISRLSTIKESTPRGIFDRVFNVFSSYVNDTEENRIKAEYAKLNRLKRYASFSKEQKMEEAKRIAEYKYDEYSKITDDKEVFRALAEESSRYIYMAEGIKLDPNYYDNSKTSSQIQEMEKDEDDFVEEKASSKDSWMTTFRQVSQESSLSQRVRSILTQIPQYYNGVQDKDDLGFPRFLNADVAHATMLNTLTNMVDSTDMIPMLEQEAKRKSWINKIIKELNNDPAAFSQFYQDMRKDAVKFWIQKTTTNSKGAVTVQTIPVNKAQGTSYLLDSWRDNHEHGIKLDDDSLYGKRGELNVQNAQKGLNWVNTLYGRLNNLSTEQRLEQLDNPAIWKTIDKLLRMIGVDANPAILDSALRNIQKSEGITFTDPVMSLLGNLHVIYSSVSKNSSNEVDDLINEYGSVFNGIADLLSDVTEDTTEDSFMEGGKSRYTYSTPNYMGKMIKNLKNVTNNTKRFNTFINTEFRKYDWFYNNGKWRNDIVANIVNSEQFRKNFDHKVVLNKDKIEYASWDSIDMNLVIMNEYFQTKNDNKSNMQMAYYAVPILSDAQSAEFLKLRKYVSGVEFDENGNSLTYDDILVEKFIDLIGQEYKRIKLVEQRAKKIKAGDDRIKAINCFDSTDNNKGGAEFKFLPVLNGLKMADGKYFIENMDRLMEAKDGRGLKNMLNWAVRAMMERDFENAYTTWKNIGLLDENEHGQMVHLPFAGQQEKTNNIIASMKEAKELLGETWSSEYDRLLNAYEKGFYVQDSAANDTFREINALLALKVKEDGISKSVVNKINRTLDTKNPSKEALREYFWNHKYATSQIIQLLTTDLAYYKNMEDFQKRFKEVHAPALRLNTKAVFEGETIGREKERSIYLKDQKMVSMMYDDIKNALDAKVESREMSSLTRDQILSQFRDINVTDSQAFRSLKSYRAILGMSGQWTKEMQQAYDNFKNNKWDISDFNTLWLTKKPYMYTQVSNESNIEGNSDIKTPVQHKNSEFLLLAMHELVAGPLGKSAKLTALNEFMEKNDIDVIQFESAVKVGLQGTVDINDLNDHDAILQRLKETTRINGEENPNVIHTLDYNDYGIQVESTEHLVDAYQLVGTQIRKLITSDMTDDPNFRIKVQENSFTKQEWQQLYNKINTENVLKSFLKVDDIFSDPKNVEKELLETIRNNPRYGIEIQRACTLDENGEFNVPLLDSIQSQLFQTLINSILKNKITKQKINGGVAAQVTNFGLTKELNIIYEGEGATKRIKHIECYLPAYSQKLFEPLMKPGTHELDIKALPEDLRKIIGYRVPTEDKYSMMPLYIKGFLPQQNGSAIMLPADITRITGSDFDFDKIYLMIPEFDVQKYNMSKARADFDSLQKGIDAISSLFNEGTAMSELKDVETKFQQWFSENKDAYLLGDVKLRKIKYSFAEDAKNSTRANNNLMIDMMWGVLTSSDTIHKILNPGGTDSIKKTARTINLIQSVPENTLRKMLNIGTEESIIKALNKTDLKTLNEWSENTKSAIDPLSPLTQVYFHQQNMTSTALIGIYASHNSNHAMLQQLTHIETKSTHQIKLNGKSYTKLNGIRNNEGSFISRNNAEFLAASVDNVKDPILAFLNQNTFTADVTMYLSRLGYNHTDIGLLLNQPIVLEMTQNYFREARTGKSSRDIIDAVLDKYEKEAELRQSVSYENYKYNNFGADLMVDNILQSQSVNNGTIVPGSKEYIDYNANQVGIGYLFKQALSNSEDLSKILRATRFDTSNGAAGPTIADTIKKINYVRDLLEAAQKKSFSIIGADVINNNIEYNGDPKALKKQLLESKLPIMQAFYTLGVQQSKNILGKFFPHFRSDFVQMMDDLRKTTRFDDLDVATMNSIYNDALVYIMSKHSFFDAVNSEGTNRRLDFMKKFPKKAMSIINSDKNIASLGFMQRMKLKASNVNVPFETLVSSNVGRLSATVKENFTRDWASLMYMQNPEAQSLAMNLIRYSYYRQGFAFGPSSFIHFAPVVVKQAIPEYINELKNIMNNPDDFNQFKSQYIRNHLNNRKMVHKIDVKDIFKDSSPERIPDVLTFDESNIPKSATKSVMFVKNEKFSEPFQYITTEIAGKEAYYQLVPSEYSDDFQYDRIEPLGIPNNYLEYSYNNDSLKSSIDQNRLDYTEDEAAAEELGQEAEEEVDTTDASFATPEVRIIDNSEVGESQNSEEQAMMDAFKIVNGEELDAKNAEQDKNEAKDMTSMNPVRVADANNQYSC